MSSNHKLDALPRWDVASIYPALDSREFGRARDQLKKELDSLDQFLSEKRISRSGSVPPGSAEAVNAVSGYLDRMNSVLKRFVTLYTYTYAFTSTDSYNQEASRVMSELQKLRVRIERAEVMFQGWLGLLSEHRELFEEVLESDGTAGAHRFYLAERAAQSNYLMSEAEEELASELSLTGGKAWEKLHGVLTSQLKTSFELDGKTEQLPITMIRNMRTHPDREVRRRAYEVELNAWETVKEPLAACLNGVKGTVNTLWRRRGRTDPLHETLDQARIDRETLDALLGTMHDSFPIFRNYWKKKAERLGEDKLPWWDLWAPVGSSTKRFSFEEARTFILEQFETFSDRLAAFARRAFDRNWIDAEPRDGKLGGAFCMGIPAVEESRILCNFDGSVDSVTTLAHELGHAYHNECQIGKTPLQRRTPMTLAETASIFSQTIVTDAALKQAKSLQEELDTLELFLIDSSQTIVDICSRFLFESEVFARREEAELSADEFCEIMIRCQKQTYGNGLDERFLHKYMWALKPHYYSPALSFYNFPYAFGMLFGLGLYELYGERGRGFLNQYDELLRRTGEATASDLAAAFGIDIRKPAFWKGALKIIQGRVNRYLEI